MPKKKVPHEGCNPAGSDLAFQTNEMGYGGEIEEAVLAHMWAEQDKKKPGA